MCVCVCVCVCVVISVSLSISMSMSGSQHRILQLQHLEQLVDWGPGGRAQKFNIVSEESKKTTIETCCVWEWRERRVRVSVLCWGDLFGRNPVFSCVIPHGLMSIPAIWPHWKIHPTFDQGTCFCCWWCSHYRPIVVTWIPLDLPSYLDQSLLDIPTKSQWHLHECHQQSWISQFLGWCNIT